MKSVTYLIEYTVPMGIVDVEGACKALAERVPGSSAEVRDVYIKRKKSEGEQAALEDGAKA